MKASKNVSSLVIMAFAWFSQNSFAGTKTLVEYGVVQENITLTSTQVGHHKLRTVAGGALGGVVGHQFGNGKGKKTMTAVGAVGGVAASRYHQSKEAGIKTVDLLIKTQAGALIEVKQSYDHNIIFNPGDKVRILTTREDTVVDKSI
ncbi:MAG TPA: glycine zipper 2TM domain-containing protein [Scandinavium sp.]|jgi:outer membrane lipoprotein SlyB